MVGEQQQYMRGRRLATFIYLGRVSHGIILGFGFFVFLPSYLFVNKAKLDS
jgi:hypothetical protein